MAALSLLRLHVTPEGSNGILTVSAIGIAVRLRSFGEGVSRPLYRYLYLHLLFHTLQNGSRHAFDAEWNAPLPIQMYPTASVCGLYPIIIHARFLD